MNQTQIVTGFNTVSLVVMLIYMIRTNLDFKNSLEELKKELSDMKQNTNDNTKRSTLSLSRLSQRLEDQSQRISGVINYAQKSHNEPVQPSDNSTSTMNMPPRMAVPMQMSQGQMPGQMTGQMPGQMTGQMPRSDDVDIAIQSLMN